MSFANINLGTIAGDHSGDPLRNAFDKVNRNFYQISQANAAGNIVSGVYSVAGRSGNVVLTVADIPGAVSLGNVSTIVQSNFSNYANLTYVNSLLPNVAAIDTQISNAIEAENLNVIRAQISALQAGITAKDLTVDQLVLGNIFTNQRVDAGNILTITSNLQMKSYVDAQDALITANWTNNAAAQASSLASLTANAATQAGQIVLVNANVSVLQDSYYSYQTQINNLWSNASAQADSINLLATTTATNSAVITANTALKAYSDAKFAPLLNPVFTSDVNVIGNLYVSGNTTVVSTNNVSINDSLIYLANQNPSNTIDIGFIGHFNNGTYQHTGLFRTASDGVWRLVSNVIPEVTTTVNITNAIYDPIQVGTITSPSITLLTDGLTGANAAIVTANSSMKNYVDAQTASITSAWTSNAATQAGQISAKAPSAAPTLTGNVNITGNIVFSDGTYQSSAASGSGLGSRTTITTSVTQVGNVVGNVNITGYKGYALYSIGTSANTTANVWVTIFSNIAAQKADYARDSGTDPTPGSGVIAEVINVGNVTQYFTPAVYGFNNENTANTNIPMKVVITSGGVANVTVNVTMLKLEN
mgnify:FL=1